MLTEVQGIDDWFELGYPLLKTSSSLRIISRDYLTDDQRKRQVIKCWMEEDEQAGWERLASMISEYMPNHRELASTIRSQYISELVEKPVAENPPSPGTLPICSKLCQLILFTVSAHSA